MSLLKFTVSGYLIGCSHFFPHLYILTENFFRHVNLKYIWFYRYSCWNTIAWYYV